MTIPQLDFRYHAWGMKTGISILDQGIFSGANFILNILLVRWLSSSSYGAFSVVFAVYLFFTGFYNAIILEPISVLGRSNHSQHLNSFLASQFRIHFIITIPVGLLMTLSGWLIFSYINPLVGSAMVSSGIALPFLLLIWLVRRVFYVLLDPMGALVASITYFGVLMSGMILLNSRDSGNLAIWYFLMGLASLIGALASLLWTRTNVIRYAALDVKKTLVEQWKFGKWIVLATFFYTLGSQIQIFFAASLLGLDAAGAFRAVQNLMLPMFQVLAAVSTLLLPTIAFEFGRSNYQGMVHKAFRATVLLLLVSVFYELVLIVSKSWISSTLYDGKYIDYIWLFPIIGLVPIVNALATGYSLLLRSLQKPFFYLADKFLAAIVGSFTALILVLNWNVSGAVFSLLFVEIISLLVYFLLYRRWFLTLLSTGSLDTRNKLS